MAKPSYERVGLLARTRARWIRWTLLAIVLLLASFFWDFTVQKNFDVVIPGMLYRSGQPRESQLEEWIREYGLKAILTFRHTLPAYERQLAEDHNIKLYHMTFSAKTGLRDAKWEDIRKVLTDPSNLPLLYHCQSGADRTGLVTALYRIEEQGWPLSRALREMIFHYHVPFRYPLIQQQVRARFEQLSHDGQPALATE